MKDFIYREYEKAVKKRISKISRNWEVIGNPLPPSGYAIQLSHKNMDYGISLNYGNQKSLMACFESDIKQIVNTFHKEDFKPLMALDMHKSMKREKPALIRKRWDDLGKELNYMVYAFRNISDDFVKLPEITYKPSLDDKLNDISNKVLEDILPGNNRNNDLEI